MAEAALAPAAEEAVSVRSPVPVFPASCAHHDEEAPRLFSEPGGQKRLFSVDGYLARTLRVDPPARDSATETAPHTARCVTVLWPKGTANSEGKPSNAGRFIEDSWFQLIRNTLARLPESHASVLHRVVVDNRPTEHGIAAHDRGRPDDGRDGHTIWLHEHLFREANHWARGTTGTYFSYHLSEDDRTLDGAPRDHTLYSPVLLHEIGHLVMYNVINVGKIGPSAAVVPECAKTCSDAGTCRGLPPRERELGCISPYCKPFRYETGTENWAEQYRFYYQSSTTRALLQQSGAGCAALLRQQEQDTAGPIDAPWNRGLPDGPPYRRSRWDSCGGSACKPF